MSLPSPLDSVRYSPMGIPTLIESMRYYTLLTVERPTGYPYTDRGTLSTGDTATIAAIGTSRVAALFPADTPSGPIVTAKEWPDSLDINLWSKSLMHLLESVSRRRASRWFLGGGTT